MRVKYPDGSIALLSKQLDLTKNSVIRRIRNGHKETIELLEKIINNMAKEREENIKKAEAIKQIYPLADSGRRKDAVDN